MLNVSHKHSKITAPLILRLLDNDPDNRAETWQIDLPDLYEDIRHNLENILNTRKAWLQTPSHLKQLTQSLVNYGIADFTNLHFGNSDAQNRLIQDVKHIIQLYEPRLKRVQVNIQLNDPSIERILKIRIEGMLETVLETSSAIFESRLNFSNHRFDFIA